jgi:hypothetical protein
VTLSFGARQCKNITRVGKNARKRAGLGPTALALATGVMSKFKMKKVLLLIFVSLFHQVGYACSCARVTAEDYLAQCENLYLARLVKAEFKEIGEYHAEMKGTFGEPIEIFQGDPKKVKGLREEFLGTSCDQFPPIGAKFLVCGAKGEKYTGYSHCSYTVGYAEHYLRDVLEYLRGKAHNK